MDLRDGVDATPRTDVAAAIRIRRAQASDGPAITAIIVPVIRDGTTYALDRDMRASDALAYWTSPDKETFVAEHGGEVVGTYYLRANQSGGGKHVCNCGYMTLASAAGRGVARAMCTHSLGYAAERGFRAMQFNFVIASNERAVRLWQSMGFTVVGRIPGAFRHPALGDVDALVMFRTLSTAAALGRGVATPALARHALNATPKPA